MGAAEGEGEGNATVSKLQGPSSGAVWVCMRAWVRVWVREEMGVGEGSSEGEADLFWDGKKKHGKRRIQHLRFEYKHRKPPTADREWG